MPGIMEAHSQAQSGNFRHFLVPTAAAVTPLHVVPFDSSGVLEKIQGQATKTMKRITRIEEASVRRRGG